MFESPPSFTQSRSGSVSVFRIQTQDPDQFHSLTLTATSLFKDTSVKIFIKIRHAVGIYGPNCVKTPLQRWRVFQKFLDPAPEADNFRNLISSSDTYVIKFSCRSVQQYLPSSSISSNHIQIQARLITYVLFSRFHDYRSDIHVMITVHDSYSDSFTSIFRVIMTIMMMMMMMMMMTKGGPKLIFRSTDKRYVGVSF